jgi:hypothetical protein
LGADTGSGDPGTPCRTARGPAGALAVTVPAVLLASGCGSAAPAAAPSGGPRVTVLAKSIRGLGTVIVSSGGYGLYVFAPDNRRLVTCTSLCAATWPPVRLPASATLVAGPAVKASMLGSDPDPAGGPRVLTYGGWPCTAIPVTSRPASTPARVST